MRNRNYALAFVACVLPTAAQAQIARLDCFLPNTYAPLLEGQQLNEQFDTIILSAHSSVSRKLG